MGDAGLLLEDWWLHFEIYFRVSRYSVQIQELRLTCLWLQEEWRTSGSLKPRLLTFSVGVACWKTCTQGDWNKLLLWHLLEYLKSSWCLRFNEIMERKKQKRWSHVLSWPLDLVYEVTERSVLIRPSSLLFSSPLHLLCRRTKLRWQCLRPSVEMFCTDSCPMCLCPVSRYE